MEYCPRQFTLKNEETVLIRRLDVSDAAAMMDLMKTVVTETRFLGREPGEFTFTLEEEREIIKNKSQDPHSLWLTAEINGRLVASWSVGGIGNRKRFQHRASMGITILKEYWGLGLGSILMREGIAWCRKSGLEQIELDVVADNTRAIALYKKAGFEISGTKKHAMKYADGTYADEYFMQMGLQ
jgi:RimJ/RimL family protein N-acetyltransferase